MSPVKSNNFDNQLASVPVGLTPSGSQMLDQFTPQVSSKPALKKPARSARQPVRHESPLRNEMAQRGNVPIKNGYDRGAAGENMVPTRRAPERSPIAQPQRDTSPQPARVKQSVNVTGISESKVGSTNSGLKVAYTETRTLNQILKLNTGMSVQGNNGTKGSKATSSTTVGVSAELVEKRPTGRKDETFTGKVFAVGEFTNSPNAPDVVKGKLGGSGRIDKQLDKTTSVYGSAGAELVIANNNKPTTNLLAQVGCEKTSEDGKLKLNVNTGFELPLGGTAEVYAGGGATVKVGQNTSLVGEIKVSNLRTELRGGFKLEI